MFSLLLVLKRKASKQPSLYFAISGMHLAMEVSHAGFAGFFVAMEMFCWINMWKTNLQLFLFLRVVIYQFRGKDSQEAFPSKQNTLNKCKEVMALFLMSCCHAMNFYIS